MFYLLQNEPPKTATQVPVPFVAVFDKKKPPDNRGGIKQVYF